MPKKPEPEPTMPPPASWPVAVIPPDAMHPAGPAEDPDTSEDECT